MKTLIKHASARMKGRIGQDSHRRIVDNVFATRDALELSAQQMDAEIGANTEAIIRLQQRSGELMRAQRHALDVAGRIAEFFMPR